MLSCIFRNKRRFPESEQAGSPGVFLGAKKPGFSQWCFCGLLGFLRFRFSLRFQFPEKAKFLQFGERLYLGWFYPASIWVFRRSCNGSGFSKRSRLFRPAIGFSQVLKRAKKGGFPRPFCFLHKSIYEALHNHA